MTAPPGYSIQVDQARHVIDATRRESDELDHRAAGVAQSTEAATAAARPGSAVVGALAELSAASDELSRGNRALIDRATTSADAAIAAYVAADGEMARQYGPFPVAPGHPVLPPDLADVLRQNGFPAPPPR